MAASAIQYRVDALAVWCFSETAPRAGDVRQSSDYGGIEKLVFYKYMDAKNPTSWLEHICD